MAPVVLKSYQIQFCRQFNFSLLLTSFSRLLTSLSRLLINSSPLLINFVRIGTKIRHFSCYRLLWNRIELKVEKNWKMPLYHSKCLYCLWFLNSRLIIWIFFSRTFYFADSFLWCVFVPLIYSIPLMCFCSFVKVMIKFELQNDFYCIQVLNTFSKRRDWRITPFTPNTFNSWFERKCT